MTGAAGFIGSHLIKEIYRSFDYPQVVAIDNLDGYFDLDLKKSRLNELYVYQHFRFVEADIADREALEAVFEKYRPQIVVNLAAKVGVRQSVTNPDEYIQSNIIGFHNILEACRKYPVQHLVFASSSSVYGANSKVPYSEDDKVDNPVSLYAATKKSNELMAHSYSKLYDIPATGLRFFTVYGPWGRPDMAPMLFANAITRGEPIKIFNNGDLVRDFTYVDDIVEGTVRTLDRPSVASECANGVPYRIFNIGCSQPVKLMDFISELEMALGKVAQKVYLPMQQGDVYQTNADTFKLEMQVGYKPCMGLREGIGEFVKWYLSDRNPLRP